MGEQGLSLSVGVWSGGPERRPVLRGEGGNAGAVGSDDKMTGWINGVGGGPTTDLSHRVSIGQLATGGAEVCRGFSHLALLLFHSLLKQMEKEVVVKQRDKHIPRLNRQERNENKEHRLHHTKHLL